MSIDDNKRALAVTDRHRTLSLASLNCDGRRGWWLLATLSIPAVLALGGASWRVALQYDRHALALGEWWRLLGAHFVHLGSIHLIFNLLGLALLWALFAREYSWRGWLLVGAAAMLGVDAGLWMYAPQVQWYVGASGALHGLWAAGALAQLRQRRWQATLPLLLLLFKLAYERYSGASALLGHLPVVTDAHLYGALGGLLPAVALALKRDSL